MKTTTEAQTLSLQDIKEQFTTWRTNRSRRREPIPQRLWDAATGLCEIHGINPVCKSLGLSYTDLKKRLSSAEPHTQFIQLDKSSLQGQWHLECDRPDGSRLRLSGNGQVPDIKMMIGTFLA